MPGEVRVQVFETEDSGLRLPAVLQQYIPHGGLLAKAGFMAVTCNDHFAAALLSRDILGVLRSCKDAAGHGNIMAG